MFYDKYAELCRKAGKSPSGAAADMGISRRSVSDWKLCGMIPGAKNLRKIAEYFGVSVNDLLEIEKDPADMGEVNSEIERLFNSLNSDQQAQAIQFLRFLIAEDTQEK